MKYRHYTRLSLHALGEMFSGEKKRTFARPNHYTESMKNIRLYICKTNDESHETLICYENISLLKQEDIDSLP